MPIDFTRFALNRVIVHDLPKHKRGSEGGPDFSEVESPLDDEVRRFLEERLKDTLHYQGYPIEFIEEHDSPVRKNVLGIFSDAATFVDVSKNIAQYLFDCQGGVNSGGLLMIADGKLNNQLSVAIVKLEREQGARIEKSDGRGKKQTFAVRHIRDLMLTQKTRVFKAALFAKDGRDARGYASDPQTAEPLAHFFLNTFLGCALVDEPKVSTMNFFEATHDFINKKVEDPQQKTDVYLSLMTEMKSAARRVSPKGFAENHIPGPLRQEFMQHLDAAKAPTTQFQKDTDLIKNRFATLKVSFASGTSVLAPPEAIENKIVKIEESKREGQLKVTVEDEVIDLKGRKR